jgi:lysosomal Pro-X carboxypeptidase
VDLLWFAIDTMAMGDYPYPSNYLTNGGPMLAAFPMRTGCEAFATTTSTSDDSDLLRALGKMAAVFNNATGQLPCFDLPSDDEDDGMWDYLWCTETLPQETYFRMDGVRDMFWPKPYNTTWINARCQHKYRTQPRYDWISAAYGGHRGVKATTNVVFSNGALDPWSSGGVSYNGTTVGAVRSLLIAQGAHHLDLMFSNPQDPQCVKDARKTEVNQITKWVTAARRRAVQQ